MTRHHQSLGPVFIRTLLLALLTMAASVTGAEEGHDDGHDDEHGAVAEVVHFSPAQRQQLGIATEAAGPGAVAIELRLTGQVRLNLDRTAHVNVRVPGVVTRVERSFGDRVEAGQLLAVLDSRELAEARARLLTAGAREELAATTYARQETLWTESIASERDYLAARQALAEARIDRRAAEQMLHALGVGAAEPVDGERLARYELRSPMGGTVVDRHVTLGELLSAAEPAFLVADLTSVWVDLVVHVEDLGRLRAGQTARVRAAGDEASGLAAEGQGRVEYLAPVLDDVTRTGTARVILDNDGRWRPGRPVTGWVAVDTDDAAVTVPSAAVYEMEARDHVFVDGGDGLRPRPVVLGRRGADRAEVLAGLSAGERVVTAGGVHVKAAFLGAGAGGHHH